MRVTNGSHIMLGVHTRDNLSTISGCLNELVAVAQNDT